MADEKKPARIPMAERFMNITMAMNRKISGLPPMDAQYYTVQVDGGKRLLLKGNDQGLVWLSCQEEITSDIMRYVHIDLAGVGDWPTWVASTGEAAFKFWANLTKPVPMPNSWRWRHEEGLTFHRVPFSPIAATLDDCPCFKEMFARTTNALAAMQWIGSIFAPDSDLQQYVWIYGHGNDGKGSLARFLTKVLASAAIWKQPPAQNDKFWTYSLLGKRLVVYGDCNQAGWVTSGPFKSMTGGDPIDIEQKYGASFSQKLTAKHLFLSNKRPTIDGDKADQRRIIYCEMTGIDGESDLGYEDRLWAEGAAFIGACQAEYAKLGGKRIPTIVEGAESLASMKEEELAYAVERYFVISPSLEMTPHDFHDQCRAIGFGQPLQQRRLYDYLNRVHAVKKLRRNTEERPWYYLGLSSKGVEREKRERANRKMS